MFGDKYKKSEVSDWETVNAEINPNTWFIEFDEEMQESEGEIKRGQGHPRKATENTMKETELNNVKLHALLAGINGDPANYQEAMQTTDRSKWVEAIDDEINSMYKRCLETSYRNDVPYDGKRQNIINSRWVLKNTIESNGDVRYKIRLVIRGFKDRNEYDLQETYALVSRLPLIRITLAIANKYDLDLWQMDVKTAFLNGFLNTPVYMEIPEGIDCSTEIKREKVCKLEKTFYGLKVSSKGWNEKFTETVKKFGLKPDSNEPCLFTWNEKDKILILILYVDDIILACNDKIKMIEVKQKLMREFDMTDVGEPKVFLGLEINRNRKARVIKISLEKPLIRLLGTVPTTNANDH